MPFSNASIQILNEYNFQLGKQHIIGIMCHEIINSTGIYNWNWYEFLKFKMINGIHVLASNMHGAFDWRIDWNTTYTHEHFNLIPFTQNLNYGTPVPSITISYTV